MKMEIKLDEERIKRDGEYTVEELWEKIDEEFENACKKKIQADGSVMYTGILFKDYYTDMMSAAMIFSEYEWFAKYCVKWLWYENEDIDDEEYDDSVPLYVTDVLAEERKENPLFKQWC